MSLSRIVDKNDYNLCDPPGLPPQYPNNGLYSLITSDNRSQLNGMGLVDHRDYYLVDVCSDNKCSQIGPAYPIYNLTADSSIFQNFYFENVQVIGHQSGFTAFLKERTHRMYVSVMTGLYDPLWHVSLPSLGFLTYSSKPQLFTFLWDTNFSYFIRCTVGDRDFSVYYPHDKNLSAIPSVILIDYEIDSNSRRFLKSSYGLEPNQFLGKFDIIGNPVIHDDTAPSTNINFCKGDCISTLAPINDKWQCDYDIDKITSDFLSQWIISGSEWPLPDWTQEEKAVICSKLDNPFTAPKQICAGQTDIKDKYCTANLSNFFSGDCIDYMKNTLTDNKQLRSVFLEHLDKICPNIKAGITPPTPISKDIWKKAQNSCACVLTEKEKTQAIENLQKDYDIDKGYLKELIARPINCWFEPCQKKDDPDLILKDYNDCGSFVVCIEKVEVDADGNVSNININQSEACKQIIKKKGGSGGGSGGSKNSSSLWIWITLSVVVIILLIFIFIKVFARRH